MRSVRLVFFVFLLCSMMLGQSSGPSTTAASDSSNVSDQIKALQDAVAQQQERIALLERQLAEQKEANSHPQLVDASLNAAGPVTTAIVQGDEKPKESPLSVRIGGTDFTPGGFMDFNNIFRTVNTGNVVATNFGGIPYGNSPQGHLPEFRSTGQYSRWSLKIGGKYGENNITGYVEGDFNGNDATNVFVTTNPHTLRLRLYFLDVRRGIWDFTAGQAWSLITPNRVGVGPMGSDLATTYSADANIHVGVAHGRDGQFRVAVHPKDQFSWAFSVENPQQITNGEVLVPTAFSTPLTNQFDGVNTPGVPNAFPDLMTKMAWDTKAGGRNFHLEFGGLMTSAKVAVVPTASPAGTGFNKHSSIGGGAMGGFNLELFKNFRVMGYGVYGDGVGRYFIGLGPQFVIRPVALTPTSFDVATSMVHAGSGYTGVEFQAGPKTQFGAYYGGVYYQRNAFPDITAAGAVKPIIGFGGIGSANTNNRAVQEGSFVWTQTLWRNPQYGAVLLINDSSYSTRAPWFFAASAPKNAHMFMDHLALRYVLP